MALGYSSRCKICNSEHRSEVERMRQEGQSYRAIQQWLKERGLSVSVPSIKNHFDEHFPVQKEAAERYYEQSKAVFEEAVEKRLSEIEMMERIAETQFALQQATAAWLADLVERRAKLPMSLVVLNEKAAGSVMQAAKTRAELLGEDEDEDKNRIDFAELLVAAWERRHEFKPDDNE